MKHLQTAVLFAVVVTPVQGGGKTCHQEGDCCTRCKERRSTLCRVCISVAASALHELPFGR
jgi:hypothetical protein